MNFRARWVKVMGIIAVILVCAYLLSTQTYRGRVLSLYVFGGFWAPVSLKYDCAKESRAKVEEKFTLPLDFDEASKNALREFWHFSYYRECLFDNGYDFGGNPIPDSEIVKRDDGTHYINYFAGTDIIVPDGTTILVDNATNPDEEDRLIASVLLIEGKQVYVNAYRSFDDVNSLDSLSDTFVNFASSTGDIISKEIARSANGADVIAITQDDTYTGFVTYSPIGRVVQVFGSNISDEVRRGIQHSLSFFTQ